MITSPLDAFDLVAHSEQLLLRLDAACAELSTKQGLREEKAWLELARERLAKAREGVGDLLTRVLRLAELEGVKEDQARLLQGNAVDAVERLHAGISFAGGARAPLLEALFGKLKIPVLRRCDRDDFGKFCTDFEKRLNTTYAKRMFGDPSYAVVLPALQQMHQAFGTWRGVFVSTPLTELESQALRDELDAVARRLEIPCRQSRLLAQAALVPLKDLLDNSGLSAKPKRRGGRISVTESDEEDEHPLLEEDPVDPTEPSAAEQAELSAAEEAGAEAREEEDDEYEDEEVEEEAPPPPPPPPAEKPRRGRKS